MQIGIFAKTFDGTTPDAVFKAASDCGYTSVQYNMACSGLASMPDELTPEQAAAVASAAASRKMAIAAVSGTYNMIHPDPAVRGRGHARLEVLAARCKAMSANMITLCTGTRDPADQWRDHPGNATPEAWSDLLESMAIAIDVAERHDIVLGIEPELANVVSSPEKVHQLIRELKSSRIKIVLDPANLFERTSLDAQRQLLAAAVDLLAGHIAMAHAKDRAADGSFVAAGKGVVDFPHFLARLKAVGFDGPLITHGLAAAEAPGVFTFLRQTLDGM